MSHSSTTRILPSIRDSLNTPLASVTRFYFGGDGINNTPIQALVENGEIVEINNVLQTGDLLLGYNFRNGYYQIESEPPVSFSNRVIKRSLINQPLYDWDTYEYWTEGGNWSDIETEQLYNGPTPFELSLEGEAGDTLESDGLRNTDLHAYVETQVLKSSQDLISGSASRFSSTYFTYDSGPPVSFPDIYAGLPYYPAQGGTYKDRGPVKGRY